MTLPKKREEILNKPTYISADKIVTTKYWEAQTLKPKGFEAEKLRATEQAGLTGQGQECGALWGLGFRVYRLGFGGPTSTVCSVRSGLIVKA